MHTRSRAFTVVELLVVVAIISVLAAVLLPALQSTMAVARLAKCTSNLRQFALWVVDYTDEWRDMLPHNGGTNHNYDYYQWSKTKWYEKARLHIYGDHWDWMQSTDSVFMCPQASATVNRDMGSSAGRRDYSWNEHAGGWYTKEMWPPNGWTPWEPRKITKVPGRFCLMGMGGKVWDGPKYITFDQLQLGSSTYHGPYAWAKPNKFTGHPGQKGNFLLANLTAHAMSLEEFQRLPSDEKNAFYLGR